MTEIIMTASDGGNQEVTNGQIAGAASQLSDAIRKHRGEVPRDVFQKVLGTPNLGMRLFAEFRRIVEEITKQIVRVVSVDRSRTPQQALDACGRKQYITREVVDAMSRGVGDKVRMTYFKPGPECYVNGVLSCAKLAEEYKQRGLKPDPQAQIDDNAANPEFADTTPNACQWVDEQGNYCYATFRRWIGGRRVSVRRIDSGWRDVWSFGGVPQESSASAV